MDVVHSDGRKEEKLLLFMYAPDTAPTKLKFVCASGKDSVKKQLGSVHKEYQVFIDIGM